LVQKLEIFIIFENILLNNTTKYFGILQVRLKYNHRQVDVVF